MADNYAIVVTTINEPTRPVIEIRDRAADLSAKFFVVGDTKSPATFELDGSEWLSIETQKRLPYKYAALCPTKHYARKNIGYLAAIADGATVIIETDDDNFPTQQFWEPRQRYSDGRLVERHGWCNAYSYFSEDLIWPRGLPLNHIQDSKAPVSLSSTFLDCPIQQGLADKNPDVDAIYRLVFPLPKNFHGGQNLILGSNVWCPFNSQNTTFWKEAFPLLYLPYYCSFRMTDIWRSFVAQRLAWECGWHILFQQATVYQERNPHPG